jgi:hypothetical protein
LPKKLIIQFEGFLGLAVLAAAGFFAWGQLGGLVFEERPVRALAEARELAQVTLDYHTDTGRWPLDTAKEIDLTLLLGHPRDQQAVSRAGSSDRGLGSLKNSHLGVSRSWLKEIPLDPWDRPYRVRVSGQAVGVLSTGPNRELDTDWSRVWTRPEGMNPCDGDDVGIVLETDPDGGSR